MRWLDRFFAFKPVRFQLRTAVTIRNEQGQSLALASFGSCANGHDRVYWDIKPEEGVTAECPVCLALSKREAA